MGFVDLERKDGSRMTVVSGNDIISRPPYYNVSSEEDTTTKTTAA